MNTQKFFFNCCILFTGPFFSPLLRAFYNAVNLHKTLKKGLPKIPDTRLSTNTNAGNGHVSFFLFEYCCPVQVGCHEKTRK